MCLIVSYLDMSCLMFSSYLDCFYFLLSYIDLYSLHFILLLMWLSRMGAAVNSGYIYPKQSWNCTRMVRTRTIISMLWYCLSLTLCSPVENLFQLFHASVSFRHYFHPSLSSSFSILSHTVKLHRYHNVFVREYMGWVGGRGSRVHIPDGAHTTRTGHVVPIGFR